MLPTADFNEFVERFDCTTEEQLELWQHLAVMRFTQMVKNGPPTSTVIGVCPNCGEKFSELKDGKIPSHDFPRPCRAVCCGSGQQPRSPSDTSLLWSEGGQ
jgi:hypothetical protein